jgi:hypothetical protein
VKWLILIVVVILAAPSIANRLTATDDSDKAAASRRRGLLYRGVRRFRPRSIGLTLLVVLLALVFLAYVLLRGV